MAPCARAAAFNRRDIGYHGRAPSLGASWTCFFAAIAATPAGRISFSFRRSQFALCQQKVPFNDALIVAAKEGGRGSFRSLGKFGPDFSVFILSARWVWHKHPTFATRTAPTNALHCTALKNSSNFGTKSRNLTVSGTEQYGRCFL
jgi:hypothetical protein